jgi:hypothetical protein
MVTTQLPSNAADGGPASVVDLTSVMVKVRSRLDCSERSGPWKDVTTQRLRAAAPWRTFRWFKGQKHYSGTYWAATCAGHVTYESRLELGRLLLADFDKSVSCVVSQPFLLEAVVEGQVRRHVPDYLLFTDDGPVVVDVKPAAQILKPVVARTFAWTREVVDSRGWSYEVWPGDASVHLSNIRFLAGFRRHQYFREEAIERMSQPHLIGMTVREAISQEQHLSADIARAALMHVLWRQQFAVDLLRPLSGARVLERPV